ncbi:hypothetical protein ACM6L3_16660 [Paenibacillus larvae]
MEPSFLHNYTDSTKEYHVDVLDLLQCLFHLLKGKTGLISNDTIQFVLFEDRMKRCPLALHLISLHFRLY